MIIWTILANNDGKVDEYHDDQNDVIENNNENTNHYNDEEKDENGDKDDNDIDHGNYG